MIRSLRRLRWLPAVLTLLSPAVGGEVLPLLHPCPVEMPWREAAAPAAEDAEHHHGHHAAAEETPPAAPSHDHGATGACSCLGDCQAPVLAAPPSAPEIAVSIVALPPFTASAPEDVEPAVQLLLDRLPPATAPPLA